MVNTAPNSLTTLVLCVLIILGSCFAYFFYIFYLRDVIDAYRQAQAIHNNGGTASFQRVPNPVRHKNNNSNSDSNTDLSHLEDSNQGIDDFNDKADDTNAHGRHQAKAAGCIVTSADTPLIILSIACFLAFILFGACLSSMGAALPEMAEYFGKSRTDFGISFTCRGVGFLLGALGSGYLIELINKENSPIKISKQNYMSISCILTGLSTGLITCTQNFDFMLSLLFFQGLGFGGVEISGNVLCAELWGDRVQPWMQALHMFFGLGAIIGPALVGALGFRTAYNCISILAAFPVLLAIFFNNSQKKSDQSTDATRAPAASESNAVPPSMKLMLVVFFYIYVGAESGFGGWISTFSLDASTTTSQSKAAFLSSVFWSFLTLGRLLAIPAAVFISATTMLRICLLIGIIGSILLLAIGQNDYLSLSVTSAVYGLALSAIYPLAMTLVSDYGFSMDASTTALFVLGSCSGESSIPVFVGLLMRYFGYDSFGYAILASTIVMVAIYLLLHSLVVLFGYYDSVKKPNNSKTSHEMIEVNAQKT